MKFYTKGGYISKNTVYKMHKTATVPSQKHHNQITPDQASNLLQHSINNRINNIKIHIYSPADNTSINPRNATKLQKIKPSRPTKNRGGGAIKKQSRRPIYDTCKQPQKTAFYRKTVKIA